jgi:hypothetical protein
MTAIVSAMLIFIVPTFETGMGSKLRTGRQPPPPDRVPSIRPSLLAIWSSFDEVDPGGA